MLKELEEREKQKSSTVPLLSRIFGEYEFEYSINIASNAIYLNITALSDSRI